MEHQKTLFGYQQVSPAEKTRRVAEVFSSVAERYDVMNDLMSFGLHRIWKRFAISQLALRKGHRVLDLAGGSGDLATLIAPRVGAKGAVVLADISSAMLSQGRDRCLDRGTVKGIAWVQANAEQLPFCEASFDRVIIGFGLRNVTDKPRALQAMLRVLKVGGMALVLEFSRPTGDLLRWLYDRYSFSVLPRLGHWVAGDAASYRYLAESIRVHPEQTQMQQLMQEAGFTRCDYFNLSGGIVAVHRGRRL